MSYVNFYLQAKEASDKIANEGSFETPSRETADSFVSRRPEPTQPESQEGEFASMIMSYMQAVNSMEGLPKEITPPVKSPVAPKKKKAKGELYLAREALAKIESAGSGDYAAIGPVVTKGTYKGQRAIGRYQVMEGNVAAWTKAAIGESMTPEQFLANPKAQDAVVEHQLTKNKARFGTWEDAASVWFSGRPIKQAGNASDGYTTVPEYIAKFNKYRNI